MNFLINYIKGLALGAGAILPGISSGVLCVIFGIYEKIIDSILGFFKDIKKNIKFLIPIFLGIGCGAILFGNVLVYLFENYNIPTHYTFIGLILGSVPIIAKKANNGHLFRLSYLFYTVISLLITLILIMLENNLSYSVNSNNWLYLILCGFFMSIGVVVPGVSSTAILMCFGIYDTYLTSVATLYFPVLISMGIGLLLGGFLFLKLIQYLLNNYPVQTYYSIIGFVFGSVLIIYPGFSFDITHIIGIICFFIGIKIANLLEK